MRSESREKRHKTYLFGLHLSVFSGLVIAQPLYDLFVRYPEFFVFRNAQPIDIFLLVLLVSFAIPLAIFGAHLFLKLLFSSTAGISEFLLIATFSALLGLLILKSLPWGGGPWNLVASVLVGCALGWAYSRVSTVRTLLTFLTPSIVILPVLFLLNDGISRVVLPGATGDPAVGDVPINMPAPIVMVVFDELPTLSLLDEHRQIDPVRYPNFRALAEDAYWFRNASTVSDGTHISVPAILDGLYPTPESPRLPDIADHPRSLFTLLQGTYDFQVMENGTRLFPDTRTQSTQKLTSRLGLMFSDTIVVYLHLLLPAEVASRYFPPITESWEGFGSTESVAVPAPPEESVRPGWESFTVDWSRRHGRFQEFIDRIVPAEEPTLFFMHSTLPHASWRYLPSGRQYSLDEAPGERGVIGANDRGVDPNEWVNDEWVVTQAQQRHLLQVGFVDRLLGDLLSHLRQIGMYDESLIVVTSDHGTSFVPGESRRAINEANHPGIMMVPLLIKLPHQAEGEVSDRNVATIDILPTIVDVLEADLDWSLDGHSALDWSAQERAEKVVFPNLGPPRSYALDSLVEAQDERLLSKLALFRSGPWSRLYEFAPVPGLIGQALSGVQVGPEVSGGVDILGSQFFENIDLEAPFLLTRIAGSLEGLGQEDHEILAVAVNDFIRAVTRTDRLDGHQSFSAVVPEDSFKQGANSVSVFVVDYATGRTVLRPIPHSASATFELVLSDSGDQIQSSGQVFPMRPEEAVTGWVVSRFDSDIDQYFIGGWAADMKELEPAERILVFQNGRLLASRPVNSQHPDAARVSTSMAASGFQIQVPRIALDEPAATEIRVIALSRRGVAGELHYPTSTWHFKMNPARSIDSITAGRLSQVR